MKLRERWISIFSSFLRLLRASGNDGISKVVNQFLVNHPTYAKRQIEMKINEVSIKEKRGDDRLQVEKIN